MKKLSGSSGRSLLLLITNITLMVLGAITVASGSILIAIFLLHLFTFASQVRNSPHLKVQANPPKLAQKKMMLFLASMGEWDYPLTFFLNSHLGLSRSFRSNDCWCWILRLQPQPLGLPYYFEEFEVAALKFNLEHLLTSMASKTSLPNILKVT